MDRFFRVLLNHAGLSFSHRKERFAPILVIVRPRSLGSVSLHELHEGMRVRVSSQAKRIVLSQFYNELQVQHYLWWIIVRDERSWKGLRHADCVPLVNY